MEEIIIFILQKLLAGVIGATVAYSIVSLVDKFFGKHTEKEIREIKESQEQIRKDLKEIEETAQRLHELRFRSKQPSNSFISKSSSECRED